MKFKQVKLSLSKYQINKLMETTGKSKLRSAIIYFVTNEMTLEPFIDKTDRSGVPVRLPVEIIDKLLSDHKSASAGLISMMGIQKHYTPPKQKNNFHLSESQRAALELLGNGSAREGLKSLIGE